jgi:lysozyme
MDFEGLRLDAYLDCVGVPTIGYGTTRYPHGQKVALGDSITEEQAEAFLKFECETVGRDILNIKGIHLNQNQFDAVVSFCYNLGMGAFRGSTLCDKIVNKDFLGASGEFLKWNKGTIQGIKVPLRGLTKRREQERLLFDKGTTTLAEATDPTDLSPEESVTSIELVKSKDKNYLLAFGKSKDGEPREPIQIVQLENRFTDTLLSAIRMYPNLESFDFADNGRDISTQDYVSFSGRQSSIPKAQSQPKLDRNLLVIGVRDDDRSNNVTDLQRRLKELGYLRGEIDGIFGRITDSAVRDFQRDYFGVSEADGLVGPKTWDKLWNGTAVVGPSRPQTSPISGRNYLVLSKTNSKDRFGLFNLCLAYFKDNICRESINVCSGQPRKQIFRTGKDSLAKSMEPLPEGRWRLNSIDWAAGPNVYDKAVWNNGLGPAKMAIDYDGPGTTARSAIEIHMDWNRAAAPGTAGCIGVLTVADFKTLANWMSDSNRPRFLYVDWRLGTCPTPQ